MIDQAEAELFGEAVQVGDIDLTGRAVKAAEAAHVDDVGERRRGCGTGCGDGFARGVDVHRESIGRDVANTHHLAVQGGRIGTREARQGHHITVGKAVSR